jgi:hypothetical protein
VRLTIAAVVPAALVAALIAGGCEMNGPAGPLQQEHHTVELGAATSARVDIDMSAGDLNLKSGAAVLFDGQFDYNLAALKPTVAYTVDGTVGKLAVSQKSSSGNYENTWTLSLDETTPIDLHVGLGAGDATLVLGHVTLQSLTVRLGAGDLKLDLRGMPARSYPVSVQAGAGDTTIQLPASAGLSVRTGGLIGDVNTSGLEKQGDRYINPRAANAAVTLDVQVQHAIGDLKISAE